MGGTALGLGRGTDLYPLSDIKAPHVLLVAPGIHVSTPEAYRALQRPLIDDVHTARLNVAQRLAMEARVGADWSWYAANDFEPAVFAMHPKLRSLKSKLRRLGASLAVMSGSGSSVFGVFDNAENLRRASAAFGKTLVYPISFLSSAQYRRFWNQLPGGAPNSRQNISN
jgi:4-diphosphocytidyl-2-C-methyl-D-erythritol kinase